MITINAGFARIPAKAAIAKLSATDWAVLHVIGLHADQDGRAFPSMARIAEIIGMKRKNIPRTIKRLEERALLRRRRVPRAAGGWLNHYELVFKPIGVLSAEDTGSEHVLSPEGAPPITVSSNGGKRVLTGEAQTDQGTEKTYQEETQKGVGVLNGGRVLTAEDSPGERCRWPLGAGCDRPAVPGMGMCARHEATA